MMNYWGPYETYKKKKTMILFNLEPCPKGKAIIYLVIIVVHIKKCVVI